MRAGITKALRSSTGASLLVALLLFLVCSVLSAAVLTAATTASGRMSELPEMDQRYYSVTSAAQLFARELSDRPVTIVRTKVVTKTVTDTYAVEADEESGEPVERLTGRENHSETVYRTSVDGPGGAQWPSPESLPAGGMTEPEGDAIDPDSLSFLTARAVRFLFGAEGETGLVCNTEEAMGATFAAGTAGETGVAFRLNHGSRDGLDVSGVCAMDTDGTLRITLQSAAEGDRYAMTLTMVPRYTDGEAGTGSVRNQSRTDREDGYVLETEENTTTTVVSTVAWTVDSIK